MPLTSQGYQIRQPSAIKEDLVKYMLTQNPSFDEFSADIQNNLLDTAVPIILQFENLIAELCNCYAPAYSNDFIWESLASTLGLTYRNEVKGQVSLQFKGETGTYIPEETEVGAFKTTRAVTIGTTGVVNVTATTDSEVEAEANTLTEINGNLEGVTVTNPSPSIAYTPQETPEELKKRAQAILRNPRIGSVDYAVGELKKIDGVVERLISVGWVQTDTQQGIELVIGGGDDYEIANTLVGAFLNLERLFSVPSDNETDRTTKLNITYCGSTLDVQWTRPKHIQLLLKVNLTFRGVTVYEGKMKELMLERLEKYINNRKVGLPLNQNTLNSVLYEVLEIQGVDRMYLESAEWLAENEEANQLTWDAYNYLECMKKDCYATLIGFELKIKA